MSMSMTSAGVVDMQEFHGATGCRTCSRVQGLVSVRLPAVGEYGLEIYASQAGRDVEKYNHICQYLLVFEHRLSSVDEYHSQPINHQLYPADNCVVLATPPSGDERDKPSLQATSLNNVCISADFFVASFYLSLPIKCPAS